MDVTLHALRDEVLCAFDQDDVNAESNELETPGYTLLSAALSCTQMLSSRSPSGKSVELSIGIKGENLTDDDVLNLGSFRRREEIPLSGTSVKVFGKIKFN